MIEAEFSQLIVDVVAIFDALYFVSPNSLSDQQLAHYSDARHTALLALVEVQRTKVSLLRGTLRTRLRGLMPEITQLRDQLDHAKDPAALLKAARKGSGTLTAVTELLRK